MARRRYNSELLCILAVLASAAVGGTYFYLKGEEPVPVVVADCDMKAGPLDLEHMHASTIKRHEIPKWLWLDTTKEEDARQKRNWRNVLVLNINDLKDGRTNRNIPAGSVMYQTIHTWDGHHSNFSSHAPSPAVWQDPFDGHLFKGANLKSSSHGWFY